MGDVGERCPLVQCKITAAGVNYPCDDRCDPACAPGSTEAPITPAEWGRPLTLPPRNTCPPACNCPAGTHPRSARTSTCGTCALAEVKVTEDGPVLECRRFPPLLVVIEDDLRRLFPQVDAEEWCGEYQPTALAAPIPRAQ